MKKFNFGLSVGLLIGFLVFTGVALADGIIKVNLLVNGQKHNAEVIMVNNKTYVPLRQFSELIGYKVDWDQKTNTISLSNDGKDYSNVDNNIFEHTKIDFHDGLEMTITQHEPTEKYTDQYFLINITNNSKQKINVSSNSFKYVNTSGVVENAEYCIGCDHYVNNFELYPNTKNSGLLLFKTYSPLKYLIYEDGVHYIEIHNIVMTNLENDIDSFYLLNKIKRELNNL